jgi:hypothetical protein
VADDATRILESFAEMAPELRRAAILDEGGELLAASSEDSSWAVRAKAVIEALDQVETAPFDSGHIATEEGEVFVVRENGALMVAVTERLVLASLTIFDMRMSLRSLTGSKADA